MIKKSRAESNKPYIAFPRKSLEMIIYPYKSILPLKIDYIITKNKPRHLDGVRSQDKDTKGYFIANIMLSYNI